MSWISNIGDKIGSAAAKIDPTSSKSVFGAKVASIVKPAVSSSAVVLTGGAVLLARPDLGSSAKAGFVLGASGFNGVVNSALSQPLPQPTTVTVGQPATPGQTSAPIIAIPTDSFKTLALFGLAFLLIMLVARDD
jgi:hypothetical protein